MWQIKTAEYLKTCRNTCTNEVEKMIYKWWVVMVVLELELEPSFGAGAGASGLKLHKGCFFL